MFKSFGGGPKCAVCNKTVYKVEECLTEIGIIHKVCHYCVSCKRRLPQGKLFNHMQELYCDQCNKKLFSTRGKHPTPVSRPGMSPGVVDDGSGSQNQNQNQSNTGYGAQGQGLTSQLCEQVSNLEIAHGEDETAAAATTKKTTKKKSVKGTKKASVKSKKGTSVKKKKDTSSAENILDDEEVQNQNDENEEPATATKKKKKAGSKKKKVTKVASVNSKDNMVLQINDNFTNNLNSGNLTMNPNLPMNFGQMPGFDPNNFGMTPMNMNLMDPSMMGPGMMPNMMNFEMSENFKLLIFFKRLFFFQIVEDCYFLVFKRRFLTTLTIFILSLFFHEHLSHSLFTRGYKVLIYQ